MKNGIIGILVAVFLLLGIGQIAEMVKPKCAMPGCDNEQTSGSRYCFLHDLSYKTYGNPDYHAIYRQSQERQKQAADTYSSNKTSGSSTYSRGSGAGSTSSGSRSSVSSKSGASSGSSASSKSGSSSGSRSSVSSKSGSSSGSRSYASSRSGSSSRSRSTDPYDADEFDNADDFADEWAEEFGDGDFEEGYEDAYDYWEEYAG